MFSVTFLVLTLLVLSQSCDPPDCDRPDCGTCVEACCKLLWSINGTDASSFSTSLSSSLKAGGPDSQYMYWGTVPNQGIYAFVVQGIHQTTTMHYNDTLNFGIMEGKTSMTCQVQAFSHSQDFINGDFAYCDDGQNYKNLAQIIESLAVNGVSYTQSDLFGCPAT